MYYYLEVYMYLCAAATEYVRQPRSLFKTKRGSSTNSNIKEEKP